MTDDDDQMRARFDLLRRESTGGVTAPPLELVRARVRRQTTRRRASLAAVVAVVAVVLFGGTQLEQGDSGAPSPNASIPPAGQRSATNGASDFGPSAVSFVSATEGWALDSGELFTTADGGSTWTTVSRSVPVPGNASALAGGQVDLYFADSRNGYVFVSAGCTSRCAIVTTDGGRTWNPAPLPSVAQLVDAGPVVYALSASRGKSVLFGNTPGSTTWTAVNLPTKSRMSYLAAEGGTLALLRRGSAGTDPTPNQLGRLWVSDDRGQTWATRANPCRVNDGAAALVSIAPGHPAALLIDCFDDMQSSQAQRTRHHIYGSGDGGLHWVRFADPTHIGVPTLLVDNGSGHAFLATQSGGENILAATLDGGLHWHVGIKNAQGFFGWSDLRFVNASTGFILGPTHNAPVRLYRTQDAGRTWHQIPLPHAD